MDLMQIRRGLLAQMSDKCLWKTVTLQEDHIADNVGNALYWYDFLGLDPEDNDYFHVVVFTNNTSTSNYRVNLLLRIAPQSSNINRRFMYYRKDFEDSDGAWSATRSLYATTDTIINVYKIPKS